MRWLCLLRCPRKQGQGSLCLPPPPPSPPASTLCFSLVRSPSHSLCLLPARGRWWDGCEVLERGWMGSAGLMCGLASSSSLLFLLFFSLLSPVLFLLTLSSPFSPLFFTPLYLLFPSSPLLSPLFPFLPPPSLSPLFFPFFL